MKDNMEKNCICFKIEFHNYDELKAIFNFMCNLTDVFDDILSVLDDNLKAMERDENE